MRKNKKKTSRIRKEFETFKKSPKLYLIGVLNKIREYIKNNTIFFTFIVSSVFNAILLRAFTVHTIENTLAIGPMVADFVIAMLFGSLCYLMKPKSRFWYLLVLNIIFTAICVINAMYYTFYNSFTSVSLLATSRFLVDVGSALTKNVMHLTDWIYVWAPIALCLVYYRLKKTGKFYTEEGKKDERNKTKYKHAMAVCFGALLVFACTLTPVKIGRFASLWNREYVVMNFGIYAYHLNDLFKSVEPKITTMFGYDSAMRSFKEYYKDRPTTQNYTNQYTGIFEGKNVIVIHAESMQAFTMETSFNGQEVTPNLNRIANESIFFHNFYAQVSVGTSSDSEFTFNTSLMPTSNGTAFVSYFDREYESIPKLLKQKGYYTFSMHGNKGNYWNRDVMHASLGYDHFYSKEEYEIDDWIGLGLSDKSFFRQSVEKIKTINAQGKPYYGTLLMLTNHTPFDQTDLYGEFDVDIKATVTDQEGRQTDVTYPYMEGTKLGDYFKSVHYADEALGEFFDALEEEGLLDNTVLVIYGDHDARLPIEDYQRLYNYDIKTGGLLDPSDENYVNFDEYQYELNRRVPFLIWSKETKSSLHRTVDTVMGMYDVMPTLGNMLGFYNKYQLGHDIFQTLDDNIVIFPNTNNWVSNKIYYNASHNEYLPLKETVISSDYIEHGNEYATNLLNASNSLIVFDLIKRDKEVQNSSTEYIDERSVKQ